MDDLLSNFADQRIELPTEDGYIYHFFDESPVGSEHDRPVRQAPAAPDTPDNSDPFFQVEAPFSRQATVSGAEDEGNYNADIDEYDDDIHEHGHSEASQMHYYPTISASEATYNGRPLLMNDTIDLDRSFPDKNRGTLTIKGVENRKESGDLEPLSPASSDGQQKMDDIEHHLRRLHRQDIERDELLERLYQEIMHLESALKKNIPDSNSRARAAEKSFFEIRKNLDKRPYVCVIIDGKGYKIHESLLQLGKQGGYEAADRLHGEITECLQQSGEAKKWDIMVHFYIDVGGLLARCVSNDIPLNEKCVRNFMVGFTQARPLYAIVDVGKDEGVLSQKVEAMFHLFANNTQCKHLIFGCCHNAAYLVALEGYGCSPIAAAKIALLKSYENSPRFDGLPFDSVEFPRVFRYKPYRGTDRLADGVDYTQDVPQQSVSNHTTEERKKAIAIDRAQESDPIAQWQATAGPFYPVLLPAHPPPKATPETLGWATEKKVLLNINNQRVDPELGEVDSVTHDSMSNRMKVKFFCVYYHLQGFCAASPTGKTCSFRHEPRLNEDELRYLMRISRRRPCKSGATCRKIDCLYGHVCPDEPGCKRDTGCSLSEFHGLDKTAVKVWTPEKDKSPRKKGSRS